MSLAAEDVIEAFNNFPFNEGESSERYGTVVQKFNSYRDAQSNEAYERNIFRKRIQVAGETLERFLEDVKKQERLCNFEGIAESMIHDQIVVSLNNDTLQVKLLLEHQFPWAKAEQMWMASQAVALQNEA